MPKPARQPRSTAKSGAIEHKTVELLDFKMDEEGSGSLTGYASTFGNFDRAGEAVVKGAFKGTLATFIRDGFVALNHNWKGNPIGFISAAEEDEKGLPVTIAFHSSDEAQDARRVAMERKAAGKSVSLSIGYKVKADEVTDEGRYLKELELYEVSLVNVPCNTRALVASVKSATAPEVEDDEIEAKGIFEDEVAERLRDPYTLFSVLMTCQYNVRRAVRAASSTVDAPAKIDEAISEFTTRLREALLYEIENPSTSDYYGYMAADLSGVEFKEFVAVKVAQSGSDLGFSEDTAAVGAAVAEFAKGAEWLEDVLERYEKRFKFQIERRVKESRTISTATDETLKAAHEHCETAEGALASAKQCVASLREMAKPKKGEDGTVPPPEVEADTKASEDAELSALLDQLLCDQARRLGVAV